MAPAPVPIVVFAYRRPDPLRALLVDVLGRPECADAPVYVFSDGARGPGDAPDVDGVRRVLDGFSGETRLIRTDAPANKGLARSVIEGVTRVLERHPHVVVLEDDLELAPGFFRFIHASLERYAADPRVFAACAFHPKFELPAASATDVYFAPRIGSLGWATWRDRWAACDWTLSTYPAFARDPAALRRFMRGGQDLPVMLARAWAGEIDSWAIVFAFEQFRAGGLSVFPRRSLVNHLVLPESSTHVFTSERHDVALDRETTTWRFPESPAEDAEVMRRFGEFWRIQRRQLAALYARAALSRVVPFAGPGADRRRWR